MSDSTLVLCCFITLINVAFSYLQGYDAGRRSVRREDDTDRYASWQAHNADAAMQRDRAILAELEVEKLRKKLREVTR